MGGLFDSDLIPLLFVLVMLANVFLDRRNRRRRQRELPQEQPQETAEPIPTSISTKSITRMPLKISALLLRLRRRS